MSDAVMAQLIDVARQVRASRSCSSSGRQLVSMADEPAPRPTFRGRVISLATARSLRADDTAVNQSHACPQCLIFLSAMSAAAGGGAASSSLANLVCSHNRAGAAVTSAAPHGANVGVALPRLDTAEGFWSLGNAELASPAQ
jgi:hypothetical protein